MRLPSIRSEIFPSLPVRSCSIGWGWHVSHTAIPATLPTTTRRAKTFAFAVMVDNSKRIVSSPNAQGMVRAARMKWVKKTKVMGSNRNGPIPIGTAHLDSRGDEPRSSVVIMADSGMKVKSIRRRFSKNLPRIAYPVTSRSRALSSWDTSLFALVHDSDHKIS